MRLQRIGRTIVDWDGRCPDGWGGWEWDVGRRNENTEIRPLCCTVGKQATGSNRKTGRPGSVSGVCPFRLVLGLSGLRSMQGCLNRKIRFAVASPCPPFLFRYASISEACTTGRLLSIESRLSIAGVRGQAWVPTQTQARLRLRGGIPARTPPAGKACGKGSKGYSDEGVAQTHQRGMIPLWKPAIG